MHDVCFFDKLNCNKSIEFYKYFKKYILPYYLFDITSLLIADGCEPQLEVHINGALNGGISPAISKSKK